MPQLLGEYECKIDAKGRLRLPSDLINQLGDNYRYSFVINRGFEKCLVLYPKHVWEGITKQIDKLNIYRKKNRDFVRYFYRGATDLLMDKTDRVLIPKRLLEYADIDKDLVLFAFQERIEIWSSSYYDNWMEDEPADFADLAEDVMGDYEDNDSNS